MVDPESSGQGSSSQPAPEDNQEVTGEVTPGPGPNSNQSQGEKRKIKVTLPNKVPDSNKKRPKLSIKDHFKSS